MPTCFLTRLTSEDNGTPWTKEHERELKAHSMSRTPLEEIAKKMKRTERALRRKAGILGIGWDTIVEWSAWSKSGPSAPPRYRTKLTVSDAHKNLNKDGAASRRPKLHAVGQRQPCARELGTAPIRFSTPRLNRSPVLISRFS